VQLQLVVAGSGSPVGSQGELVAGWVHPVVSSEPKYISTSAKASGSPMGSHN
jgi:hypothetical protein